MSSLDEQNRRSAVLFQHQCEETLRGGGNGCSVEGMNFIQSLASHMQSILGWK